MSSSSRGRSKAPAPRRCSGRFDERFRGRAARGSVRRAVSPALFGDAGPRDSVGPLVFGVAGMAAHPFPSDDVPCRRSIEPLPTINILDRLLVGGEPVAPLPAVYPFGDAVAQILAVAVEPDATRPLQRFEPSDRGHHLHPVVGRLGLIAAQFLFDLAIAQYRGPAARARVAAASAVSEDLDIGQLRHPARSPRYW